MGLFNWQQKKIDDLIDKYFSERPDDDIDYDEKLLEMGKPAAERLFLALKSEKYDSSGLWLDGLSLLVRICNKAGEENIIEEAFNVFNEELFGEDLDILSLSFLLDETEGIFHDLTMEKLIEIGRQDLNYLITEIDFAVERNKPIITVNDPGVKVESSFYITNDFITLLGYYKSSPKAVDQLIKWFKDISTRNWRDIVKNFVNIGSLTVSPLINLLFDPQEDIKARAAFALGKIGDAKAIESLVFVLQNDSSGHVRFRAAESLERIGKPAVDSLISSLHHQNQQVRRYAAEALGSIGDDRALDDLCRLLKDSDQEVREQAEKAIQKICEKNSLNYEKVISDFQSSAVSGRIKERTDNMTHTPDKKNAMEALKKLKELLDIGAITQAEYQMKKSKLMKEI